MVDIAKIMDSTGWNSLVCAPFGFCAMNNRMVEYIFITPTNPIIKH